MTETEQFCQIRRERSPKNILSGQLLYQITLYGQLISVVRQALDFLVRAVFLVSKDLKSDNISCRKHYKIKNAC